MTQVHFGGERFGEGGGNAVGTPGGRLLRRLDSRLGRRNVLDRSFANRRRKGAHDHPDFLDRTVEREKGAIFGRLQQALAQVFAQRPHGFQDFVGHRIVSVNNASSSARELSRGLKRGGKFHKRPAWLDETVTVGSVARRIVSKGRSSMYSLSPSLAFPVPNRSVGSPAILRLQLLEARIAARRPMDENARRHAAMLIDSLRRAIAARPCLSFADVVAKLKTWEEIGGGTIGPAPDELRKALLEGALAGLSPAAPPNVSPAKDQL